MTDDQKGPPSEDRGVHVDIDNAEQLVATSSAHARGEIDDAAFLERREQLLTGEAEPAEEGAQ